MGAGTEYEASADPDVKSKKLGPEHRHINIVNDPARGTIQPHIHHKQGSYTRLFSVKEQDAT